TLDGSTVSSAWGSGGRGFKSPLPDQTQAPNRSNASVAAVLSLPFYVCCVSTSRVGIFALLDSPEGVRSFSNRPRSADVWVVPRGAEKLRFVCWRSVDRRSE